MTVCVCVCVCEYNTTYESSVSKVYCLGCIYPVCCRVDEDFYTVRGRCGIIDDSPTQAKTVISCHRTIIFVYVSTGTIG